jgi:excinuclease ABC subunit C
MTSAAEDLNFEAAAKLRDRIRALDACRQTQKVVGAPDEERDVIAVYRDDFCSAISVFFVRDGCITDSETEVFGSEQISDDADVVAYLSDFYLKREFIPDELSLDFPLSDDDREDLTEFIRSECKKNVKLRFPEKGPAKQLCAMVRENARELAAKSKSTAEKQNEILLRLAQLTSLEVVPELIEAYDISNMGSDNITAGKISVLGGSFNKSAYRTYKIKDVSAPDDYASMREAIRRRLCHPEDTYPDLILLDGGKGHVSVITELLAEMNVDIPVLGMVKDDYHKTRALTSLDSEISIARETAVFNFIYKIQEEVHRFTFGNMQKAKRKTLKRSSLNDIDGIGPAKAKALMTHFKSIEAIKTADVSELAAVKGLNKRDADTVYLHFHPNDDTEI